MEKKKIVISPVTRIEGHAKITIDLNEQGVVDDDSDIGGLGSGCCCCG